MSTAALRETSAGRRFRFEGVLLDEAASRLFVDGRERLCSQRALRLLVIMCEAAGQVLPKQQVIDKLWPGGQIVSDEALTQAVFRARACLDRYADRLVTVRGVGLRLDAHVHLGAAAAVVDIRSGQAIDDPSAIAMSAPAEADVALRPPVAPTTTGIEAPRHDVSRSRRGAWLVGLLAILLAVLLLLRPGNDDVAAPIDTGWGLVETDAHVSRPETVTLLREAFQHEGRGDRARASALLETAHASDPSSPLPAMFLALWAIGLGDATDADRWLDAARTRLRPISAPLLTALLRYIEAERAGSTQDVLRYAGAILDLRPEAWQLRLARAHLLRADGLPDAALRELSAMQIDTLSHRKLAMALADRASFGDPDGAEAVFLRIADTATEESTRAFLRGRFAWSRDDYPAAAQAFQAAADAARREARFDLAHRSTVNLGVISMLAGDRERAIRSLEQARTGMAETRWSHDVVDIGLILAQLHALEGDTAAVAAELEQAERTAANSNAGIFRDLCKAFRARLLPGTEVALPEADSEPALAPLLAAHAALQAGDRVAARTAYISARRKVAPTSPLHDEVRWLAATLGEDIEVPTRVDPPWPPLSRLATRLAPPLSITTEQVAP